MKKIILSLCLSILNIIPMMGITYEEIPTPRYHAKSNRIITDIKSPCNQGEEPFYKFFNEFHYGDSSFIAERTLIEGKKLTIGDLYYDCIFNILQTTDFLVTEKRTGFYVENDEIITFQLVSSWFNVSKDQIFFASGEDYDKGRISIGTLLAFERINDKWYLTFVLQAG